MAQDGLSVQVEQEAGGRWTASVRERPAARATSDSPSGALRALADRLRALERFGVLLEKMRERAQKSGRTFTEDEIEAEIAAARTERRHKQ
jgi:hypothetical protein